MTDFLVVVKALSEFNKKDIDQGKTPQDIYKICSCIRNTFCLSYFIRKTNNFYLFIEQNQIIIKFVGKTLRYLGPDERSQSLLLAKALKIKNHNIGKRNGEWIKSTPGILVTQITDRHNILEFLVNLDNKFIIIFDNKENSNIFLDIEPEILKKIDNSLLIFTINELNDKDIELNQYMRNYKNLFKYTLPKIKTVEDKILYVNFQIDRFKLWNNNEEL